MVESTAGGTAASGRIRSLTDELHIARVLRDTAKMEYERLSAEHDEIEAKVFEAIENAGLKSVRTPVGLFTLSDLAWPKIEDRERLVAWAEAENPELISVNLQRLQTPLREAIAEGRELPPGLGYSISRKVRLTRAKDAE